MLNLTARREFACLVVISFSPEMSVDLISVFFWNPSVHWLNKINGQDLKLNLQGLVVLTPHRDVITALLLRKRVFMLVEIRKWVGSWRVLLYLVYVVDIYHVSYRPDKGWWIFGLKLRNMTWKDWGEFIYYFTWIRIFFLKKHFNTYPVNRD